MVHSSLMISIRWFADSVGCLSAFDVIFKSYLEEINMNIKIVCILLATLLIIDYGESAQRLEFESRILGGSEVSSDEFPSLLAIFRGEIQICGGTLISPKHVLTAAHCIYQGRSYEFSVLAGVTNLADQNGISIGVRGRMWHPRYHPAIPNFDFLKNDIGVLKLVSPVDVTSPNIAIAKLPMFDLKAGTVGLAPGWGSLGMKGEKSNYLRKGVIYVWPLSHCKERFSWHTSNQFCGSGYDIPTNMCYGDSGGPFIENGTVFGVLSVSTCSSHGTITYTKVFSYLSFIGKALKF